MPKNIDPGQRAQKKDARKGAAFFALVQLAMALLLLWGRSQLAGLEGLDRVKGAAAAPVDPGSGRPGDHPSRVDRAEATNERN